MEPDPNAIDWNAFGSALIGGGFALAGAFVAAWRERIARQTEEKARFQRDTLIALQDAIEAHVRATEQIQFWRDRPHFMEEGRRRALGDLYMTPQGDALIPPPGPMDLIEHGEDLGKVATPWHDTRYPVERLASRVANRAVRDDVEALIATARTAMKEPVMGRINKLYARLNEQIGLLIREGTVTPDGFVAPDHTMGRSLL